MEVVDLLKAIKERRTVIDVCHFFGGDHRIIINYLNELVVAGAINRERGQLTLTCIGIEMIEILEKEIYDKNNEFHLSHQIEKIDVHELYKPRKKNFLRAMSRDVYNANASSQISGDSLDDFRLDNTMVVRSWI